MKVFNVYFKIFKKNSLIMSLIYMLIFLSITFLFISQKDATKEDVFNISKCKVAIVDNDNSELSRGLQNLLSKNAKIVKLSSKDKENLKDALFFRFAECIYTIPKGFQENYNFESNDMARPIESLNIPYSASSTMINQLVNKYFNTVDIYIKTSNMDISKAVDNAMSDLSKEASITLKHDTITQSKIEDLSYYFNYLAYPIIAVMILSISTTLIKLNNIDIKRRNICSPICMTNFNVQLFISNIVISLVIYLVFMVMAVFFYKGDLFTPQGLLLMLNALIFTINCLGLAFLIANISNEKTISAISTTFSVLFSFIGGVFVPQYLLSKTVKNIAIFIPTFWYVKANNIIRDASIINLQTLKPYINSILIQLCFTLAFVAISLVIIKQKRTSE